MSRARYDSPELQGYLSDVLSGQYLDTENPHLSSVLDKASSDIQSQYDQQRAQTARATLGGGRLGSTWHRQAAGRENEQYADSLAEALGGLRFQSYESERDRQNAAAQLQQGRDAAIWNDETSRYGIDAQARSAARAASAQRAAAAASSAAQLRAARMGAEVDEARVRTQYLLGMAGLGEEARQFDAGLPIEYAQAASGLLGTLGQQDLAGASLTGDLANRQEQNQLSAAGLGLQAGQVAGALDQGFTQQQLAGLSQIPGLANADLGGYQMAGNYLSDMHRSDTSLQAAQAAASASRANARAGAALGREQLQFEMDRFNYGTVRDQYSAADPNAALANYLGSLGAIGSLAGTQSSTRGEQAGSPVAGGQSPWLAGAQAGLGTWLSLYANQQNYNNSGGGGRNDRV